MLKEFGLAPGATVKGKRKAFERRLTTRHLVRSVFSLQTVRNSRRTEPDGRNVSPRAFQAESALLLRFDGHFSRATMKQAGAPSPILATDVNFY